MILGVVLGGLPIALFWGSGREINWLHGVVLVNLLLVATAFGQMALAGGPFARHDHCRQPGDHHDSDPAGRLGLSPAMRGCQCGLLLGGLGVYGLLFRMPRMWMEAVALWAFWVFVLYEGMVVMRMLGLTYHAHAVHLVWFRRRPRWATSRLHGRIYNNS